MYIIKMTTDYPSGFRSESYLKSVGLLNTFTGRIEEAKRYKTKKETAVDIKTVKGGKRQRNRTFEVLQIKEGN